MRRISLAAALLLVSSAVACTNERDIIASLQKQLSSVNGNWTGISTAQNSISLDFTLQQASNGQVSGTGTMKEQNATSSVPITVSGTFAQPTLTLTFDGMRYEGHDVRGTAQGAYTTVGGISTTLQLTGTSYSAAMPVLLQEK